jgi:hypothetical protein
MINHKLVLAAVLATPIFAFATMAHAELLTLQGDTFADITRAEHSVDITLVPNSSGSLSKCGLLLRSNKPFAFTGQMNALANALTVTEQFNGELATTPPANTLSLTYNYLSRPFGTSVTIATKGGETLAAAVATAFAGGTQADDTPAQVIATLIPCTL